MKKQDEQHSDFNHPQSENQWSQKNEHQSQEETAVEDTDKDNQADHQPIGSDADHADAAVASATESTTRALTESGEDPNHNAEVENKNSDTNEEQVSAIEAQDEETQSSNR